MLKRIETIKFSEYAKKYFERNIRKGCCKFKYISAKFVKIEKTNIKFHFPFLIIIYNDNKIKTILYTGKDKIKNIVFIYKIYLPLLLSKKLQKLLIK